MTETEENAKTPKKKHHCGICQKKLNEDEVYELDEMILCEDCFHTEQDMRAILLEDLAAKGSGSN